MPRSLSLRYLLFKTVLIPNIRVFYPRAESATFFVRHNDVKTNNHDSGILGPGCDYLCNNFARCYKDSRIPENQRIISHVATIFCNRLAKLLQRAQHPRKTNTSHHSHVATIFCNHLAKLLQKSIASQKNQHIASLTCCYYLL